MKGESVVINERLKDLRREKGYSLEYVAEKINVSRQTVSKWESGETVPDVLKCKELADIYDISMDELLAEKGEDPEEKRTGKYAFGVVRVGERGQIVIPSRARKIFGISKGDMLLFLGDIHKGIPPYHKRNVRDSFPTQIQACQAGWKAPGNDSSVRCLLHKSSCQ